MNGQWIGRLSGTNDGQVIVEFDDVGARYEGVAYFYDYNSQMPAFFAYFAYQSLGRQARSGTRKCRILIFDRIVWQVHFRSSHRLSPVRPHFSVLEVPAIDNPRIIPQQALLSVTNVDDIEDFIFACEESTAEKYLQAIDLPSLDRKEVMQELALMGITNGSLFPGLDGACGQLKERFFDL
jgi:hypothetical protein